MPRSSKVPVHTARQAQASASSSNPVARQPLLSENRRHFLPLPNLHSVRTIQGRAVHYEEFQELMRRMNETFGNVRWTRLEEGGGIALVVFKQLAGKIEVFGWQNDGRLITEDTYKTVNGTLKALSQPVEDPFPEEVKDDISELIFFARKRGWSCHWIAHTDQVPFRHQFVLRHRQRGNFQTEVRSTLEHAWEDAKSILESQTQERFHSKWDEQIDNILRQVDKDLEDKIELVRVKW